MAEEKRKKGIEIFLYTVVIAVFAHGYRFMNNLYTSDALVEVFQDDIYWQRSLGRFLQPLIMVMRGVICSPWLIGCIAVVLLSLAVYWIAELLEIENRILLFVLCGVLTCNATVSSACAAFLPWVDVYALALLLAILGVRMYWKDRLTSYVFGSILLVCSLGLYQAYIDVALAMIVILLLGKLMKGEDGKAVLLQSGKIAGSLLGTAVVYWGAFKLVLKIHHVAEATGYNGLSGVGQYGDVSFFGLIADTYVRFFKALLNPETFVSTVLLEIHISDAWAVLLKACFIVCALLTVGGIVVLNIRNKTTLMSRILQSVMILLFPLLSNAVNLISKGMEHDLMVYGVFFFYVLMIFVADTFGWTAKPFDKRLALAVLPLLILIWNNSVYSNQVYFKVDMQDRAAMSYATRVVSAIEQTEGYEAGVTPVVIIGRPEASEAITSIYYLRELEGYGTETKTPFSYESSFASYLKYHLAVNMNIIEQEIPGSVADEMDSYPGSGAIRFYGDTLIVKLSD